MFFPVYPKQAEFLDSKALFRGFVGGRGAGKSRIGAYDLLSRAQPGRLYLLAAPTYQMLEDSSLRSLKEVAGLIGRGCAVRGNKGDMAAYLDNGAEILCRSTDDADRLRGPNLSGCWLDEASQMHRDAFDVVIASLRELGEQGWLSATFTPKGRLHWTYEVFGEQRKPGTELVHARTDENPFISEEFYETVRAQYAGLRAAQELGGEFVDVEGAEWPPEYFEDIWFEEWPKELLLRVQALDPSQGKDSRFGDYSANVNLGATAQGMLYVEADLERRPAPKMVADGIANFRLFCPNAWVIEINQFQALLGAEILRVAHDKKLMLPLYGIDNRVPKEVRIRTLGPLLYQKRLKFRRSSPGARLLVEQMRAFPEGEHDDGPDALEMGVRMLNYLLGNKGDDGGLVMLRA